MNASAGASVSVRSPAYIPSMARVHSRHLKTISHERFSAFTSINISALLQTKIDNLLAMPSFSWLSSLRSMDPSLTMSSDAASVRSGQSGSSVAKSSRSRVSTNLSRQMTNVKSISGLFSDFSLKDLLPVAAPKTGLNIETSRPKRLAKRIFGTKHTLSGRVEPWGYEAVFSTVDSDPVKVQLELKLRFQPEDPRKYSHYPTDLLRTLKTYIVRPTGLADLPNGINAMCTQGEVPAAIQKKLLEEIESQGFSHALNLVE
jgi:hypothetical protein